MIAPALGLYLVRTDCTESNGVAGDRPLLVADPAAVVSTSLSVGLVGAT